MPYRRLPNTDAARLKALRTALQKGEDLSPVNLAYSQKIYYKIRSFIPTFEGALYLYTEKKEALSRQSKLTNEAFRKARLFLTHFLQVTYFAIQRGELAESTLKYFGLDSIRSLPPLQNFQEVVDYGKRILEGEKKRVSEGKQPVSNPTAAVVNVRYEVFLEAYHAYQIHKQNKETAQAKILNLRKEADRLIAELWDHIERSYEYLPDNMRRQKAAEYGVTYVFRKNELRHLESLS